MFPCEAMGVGSMMCSSLFFWDFLAVAKLDFLEEEDTLFTNISSSNRS